MAIQLFPDDLPYDIDTVDSPAPPLVTSPFSIIIDTREQAPWRFTGMVKSGKQVIQPVITDKGLKSGDYAIDGHQDDFAIERKSKADLYGSCISGRDRFKREIKRLNEMSFAAVVVEADELEITESPPSHTAANPESIRGTILSWSIRFPRVHWFLCSGRRRAEVTAWKLLDMWWKILNS